MTTMLYIARSSSRVRPELIRELKAFGEFTLLENGKDLSRTEIVERIRGCQILFTLWDSVPVPPEIAQNPGKLAYICNISGSVKPYVPLEVIDAGIPVTNWGDSPANEVAEGAVTLLMGVMKNVHAQIQRIRNEGWKAEHGRYPQTSLAGLNVGIYGYGATGRRFADMIRGFKPVIRIFDPYAGHVPEEERVGSLEELFSRSEAVIIHAALSEETEGSVNARLLALLPDHGMIINTARGAIIDQKALFAELESGRLRAGLDVLDGNDQLPVHHPARRWENCIFTAHQISHHDWPARPGTLSNMEQVCLDNVKRFTQGETLMFIMDQTRYRRST